MQSDDAASKCARFPHLASRRDSSASNNNCGLYFSGKRKEYVGQSPTFGPRILFFFQKSTTRSYYLMHLSHVSMRGAEIWHIWKQHHLIAWFWKILKSIFHIRAMQLQGHGLYT